MTPVFLIGGGWRAETFTQTYGRFLQAASQQNTQRRIAIIVAEEPDSDTLQQFFRYLTAFESVGLDSSEAAKIIVSAEQPLTKEILAETKPTGIFVCGGLTPAYYEALCLEKTWLTYLLEKKIPYCGFSAGAALSAKKAIVGGWRREINNKTIEIADENAGEDIHLLAVRNGLDLVPFAVDVHATQWGTLSRLFHTIDAKLADEGWAIDENTMLEFDGEDVQVYGAGNAYRIKRQKDEITISSFQAEV